MMICKMTSYCVQGPHVMLIMFGIPKNEGDIKKWEITLGMTLKKVIMYTLITLKKAM